jgi:hypothetical protein
MSGFVLANPKALFTRWNGIWKRARGERELWLPIRGSRTVYSNYRRQGVSSIRWERAAAGEGAEVDVSAQPLAAQGEQEWLCY